MSIDARIASVAVMKDHVWLRLRPIQASDGVLSTPGKNTLIITPPYTKLPLAGQQIWGNAGACIVEAGFGGERIEYEREGHLLREKAEEANEPTNL